MRAASLTAVLTWSLLLSAAAGWAQDALERLEQRLADEDAADDDEAPAPRAVSEPGYLGAITDDRQDQGDGVRIVEVVPGGPADAAGLADGDLVTAIDDVSIRGMADLARMIERSKAGRRLRVKVERAGEARTVEVTLGKRPPPEGRRFDDFGRVPDEGEPSAPRPAAAGDAPPTLGVAARSVTEESARRLGLESADGVLVTEVAAGSPADRAGLSVDDVIVAAAGERVDQPSQLAAIVRATPPGEPLELELLVRGELRRLLVPLDEAESPSPALPADDDPRRVEDLERRIRQLERRVEALEAALRQPAPE
jgi:serine protease Do